MIRVSKWSRTKEKLKYCFFISSLLCVLGFIYLIFKIVYIWTVLDFSVFSGSLTAQHKAQSNTFFLRFSFLAQLSHPLPLVHHPPNASVMTKKTRQNISLQLRVQTLCGARPPTGNYTTCDSQRRSHTTQTDRNKERDPKRCCFWT